MGNNKVFWGMLEDTCTRSAAAAQPGKAETQHFNGNSSGKHGEILLPLSEGVRKS